MKSEKERPKEALIRERAGPYSSFWTLQVNSLSKDSTRWNTNKLPAIKEAQVRGADSEREALKSSLSFSRSFSTSFFSPWHNRQHIQATRTAEFSLIPWHPCFFINQSYSLSQYLVRVALLNTTVWIAYGRCMAQLQKVKLILSIQQFSKEVNSELIIFYKLWTAVLLEGKKKYFSLFNEAYFIAASVHWI